MKRNILILVISVIVLIVMILIIKPNNKNNASNVKTEITDEDINFDENTSLYYIRDEETGEIINASHDLESFDLYKIDPDYNPNPQFERKTDLEDYIEEEYMENEEPVTEEI